MLDNFSFEARYGKKYEKIPEAGCWIWTGCISKKGYGQIVRCSKRLLAHRVSWNMHAREPIPCGLLVCHRCDVTSCVNPAHLYLGQQPIINEMR